MFNQYRRYVSLKMEGSASSSLITNDNIEQAVPSDWKYKIVNKIVYGSPSKLEVCLKVALFNIKDVESWIEALEEKTQCSYSIQMTKKTAALKVLFKRRYHCRLKTKLDKVYPDPKSGTRNTKCPSRISITLMNIKNKKFRGKYPPDPEMPCIIDYVITHNHSISLAARFRKVTKGSQEKLEQLFNKGHSASTAYETLRIDAQLMSPENYEDLLVNRSICPDRNYCYKWYSEYKKEHSTVDMIDSTFMPKRIAEYNSEVGEECAKYQRITTDDYVIALCPLMFKRVHQNIHSSSEVVFMAAINPAGNDGSKAFFLMTSSECGALPLGIIITSSETTDLITVGLRLLQVLIGEKMFFGVAEGPKSFVVDDCEAGQLALNAIWPKADIFFCSLHILYTLWKYLLCSKNGINRDEPIKFFKQFRTIMYAETTDQCDLCYSQAVIDAAYYPNYKQILEAYWERRDMWVISYRNTDNLKLSNFEKSMCLLLEPIFHRMRSFNVIQLVDFLLTKFVDFYTLRLLDAANDRPIRNLARQIPYPPDIGNIEQVNDYLYLVPSIKLPHVKYYVNIEIVACTCLKYTTGYICNHIGWLLTMLPPDQVKIEDFNLRKTFYKTAMGDDLFTEEVQEDVTMLEEVDKMEPKMVDQLIIAGSEVIKLEIVKEETDQKVINVLPVQVSNLPYVTAGVLVPVLTDTQAIEAGEKLNKELFSAFEVFLKKSPFAVAPVLQQMVNKAKNFTSVDEFLAACKKFNEVT